MSGDGSSGAPFPRFAAAAADRVWGRNSGGERRANDEHGTRQSAVGFSQSDQFSSRAIEFNWSAAVASQN